MPLIVLGVSVFGGLLALIEISRNRQLRAASAYRDKAGFSAIINLPADIEREKKRRNII